MTPDDPVPDLPQPIVARSIREILLHELKRTVPSIDPDGGPVMKVELLARRLVQKGIDGDLAAIKEITNRADGRAPRAPRPRQARPQVILKWLDSHEVPDAGHD